MRHKQKTVIAAIVTVLWLGVLLAACSSNSSAPSAGNQPAQTEPPKSGTSATEGEGSGGVTYPIQTDVTLTYWLELTGNLVGVKASHDEVPFFQELQKRTGVPLKFISVPNGKAKENLNVMLASGDYPDLIEYNFLDFPGGPEKAISDGYILKLNDLIDKHAPNLKKYLQEHPEIDKMVKTDNGNYFAFPFIRGDDYLRVYQGPIIRKDWLDDLGLPVPETIDEWYTTLKAFKEQKGAAAPFAQVGVPRPFNELGNGAFVGAFGVTRDFYLEDGKVKFGPMEPGYKEFLATFRKWYEEGLIDKNIATIDMKAMDANFSTGATGATVQNTGAGIGRWQPLLAEKDPKALLVAAPYPVLNKGDRPFYGQKDQPFSPGGMVAISASSKHPELAAQMLDYGYSPEGHMFYNFGIEGVSYTMEGDYPKYTELLLKNPDGLAPAQVFSQYTRANYNGPFVQDRRYIEQYLVLDTQREALEVWSQTDVDKHKLPPVTPTPEESTEFAKIKTDLDTLVDEMTLKIILGTEPVDSFENYVEKMKSINIDRAIEIMQAALDRFNKR